MRIHARVAEAGLDFFSCMFGAFVNVVLGGCGQLLWKLGKGLGLFAKR